MKKCRIAALAAAVIVAAAAAAVPVNAEHDIVENKSHDTHETFSCIGSVSKIFATTAVLQLAEQGKVDIDKPVADYLPDFRMADPRYKDITVRMLMNHSSGLMGTTAGDFMLFDDRDEAPHDTMLKELSTQRLKADPGDFGAYCNDGFELLELITEQVSGMSFTDYIEKNICSPLGMQQTGTAWNAFRTDEQVKTFHSGNVTIAADYCMDIGSGGIMSTASELCKFGSAFFKGDNSLLSDISKQEMNKTEAADKYEDGFGLGWDQVDYDDYKAVGVKLVSKGGDIINQHAGLLVAPDEKISVAVLSSGGNSMCNELMGMALMDIALAEKGIKVEHKTPEEKTLVDTVPEKYLAYEDIYITSEAVYTVSFPDRKYMEISCISSDKKEKKQYMYTSDDDFVLMDGNVPEGKAVQAKEQSVLTFRSRNGMDYICADNYIEVGRKNKLSMSSYNMQRAKANPVSDDVQSAWDKRSGKKYYLYSGKYSNTYYSEMPSVKIKTMPEAKGYTSSGMIVDSNNTRSALVMPGGRDIQDITVKQENGYEILDITNCALEFISEDAIPQLESSMTEVKLSTKKASWFSIGSAENKTLILDMPENAAVYVYDQYDRMTYSSYMTDYGNSVPLPANGKIVFLGEDGGVINITQ
ncbi:serine hydrolase domain-containing protein [Ruminococcus flavefaciens]|uniref:CubicO group peptidase, beta-lactamase class C family n=1 Tax=Ruminococcus flavefaciens TaxID=1265 RepID=A0A1M7JLC7_RUMFL|nr:serine hydrolase domain-containing protein [Ruminococcus flavefaciens]SHM53798.1 CubicO group peptidase, beta-lactamase class C family [Ruminococcus flavefaciens]